MNNQALIEKFYQSFAKADVEGMLSCYHADIQFTDPAFGTLKGDDARNMWRMLIERSKGEIKIAYSHVLANDTVGSAHWRAEYVFAQTARNVINEIDAQFEFKDGKIITHTDRFNLWKWGGQALGWGGLLLGWSGFFRSKLQKQTNSLLKKYTEKRKQ
jgi:ketosteroid isomerase-like protein